MKQRQATILASESATTPATKTIDITLEDVISRLGIRFTGTNSTNVPIAHPAKMITKVELVDGSDVLLSLSGIELQALEFYHTGKIPANVINYRNNEDAEMCYEIYFGRALWDRVLALDPKKFANPQLKITHNLAAGGSTPDAATLEVVADIFDESQPSPIGFLMNKEFYTYTLVANAHEYVTLPKDYPLRFMMIQSLYAAKMPPWQINNIKLSENNDKKIPIDARTLSFIKYITSLYPELDERIDTYTTTAGVTHYVAPTYEVGIEGCFMGSTPQPVTHEPSYGGTAKIYAGGNGSLRVGALGRCPHGAIPIPFGDQMSIEDWYDITKLSSLRLDLYGDTSPSGTAEIILQQLRKY